jgi:hypothetical protein
MVGENIIAGTSYLIMPILFLALHGSIFQTSRYMELIGQSDFGFVWHAYKWPHQLLCCEAHGSQERILNLLLHHLLLPASLHLYLSLIHAKLFNLLASRQKQSSYTW